MKTPATMLYGHIEEPRHRVDHVLRLRELQDETGGFAVFIPLRYQHDFVDSADGKIRNRIQARTTMASPAESLKTFAVSRLMFDNVPHVKCFWVMHGLSVAQLSLNFGVDDLDGSVVEYKITHDADSYGTPNTMHRDDLLQPDLGRRFPAGRAQHPLQGGPRVRQGAVAGRAPLRAAAGLGPDRSIRAGERAAGRVSPSGRRGADRRPGRPARHEPGRPGRSACWRWPSSTWRRPRFGAGDFGGANGWLAVILPVWLFWDDFRAWEYGAARVVAALVGGGARRGLRAAGRRPGARGCRRWSAGALGAAVFTVVYAAVWFPGVRWLATRGGTG